VIARPVLPMRARTRPLLLPAAILAVLLTGCAVDTAAEPSATPTDAALGTAPGGDGDSPDTETDEPESALAQAASDGMPALPLTECAELVSYEYRPTEANLQWAFEYLCTSREAFDTTTAALLAEGFAQPQAMSAGNQSYISDWNHFIAQLGGVTDVDLKIKGDPDELEYVVLVTVTPES
jgi:hypothetical protein